MNILPHSNSLRVLFQGCRYAHTVCALRFSLRVPSLRRELTLDSSLSFYRDWRRCLSVHRLAAQTTWLLILMRNLKFLVKPSGELVKKKKRKGSSMQQINFFNAVFSTQTKWGNVLGQCKINGMLNYISLTKLPLQSEFGLKVMICSNRYHL